MGNAPSSSEPVDAQQRALNSLMNPNESDIYENLADYQRCTLAKLSASLDIWREVFNSKRLVTYDIFDEVFGHVLGDPDEHFPIFTGDDFKRRHRTRTALLNADKADKVARDKERRSSTADGSYSSSPPPLTQNQDRERPSPRRSGSISRGSVSFGAGGLHGAFAMSDAGMSLLQAAQSTHKIGTTPFKRSAMVDVFEAFSILCLLSDDAVEAKLTFIFMLFGRNSSSKTTTGLAQIQFRDILERLPAGVQKLMGFQPPEQKFVDNATFALFGKSGSKDLLSFKEFWEWCQDEVEVAAYLQRVVQFSFVASSVYKQEVTVSTDQYLQNSKLMEDDSDNEDENASGINRVRPQLLTALVKTFANTKWWDDLPTLNEKDRCLDAMRRMAAAKLTALPVFNDHKRYLGLVDCMELTSTLVKALATCAANNERARVRRNSRAQGLAKQATLTSTNASANAVGATNKNKNQKSDSQHNEVIAILTFDDVINSFLLESPLSDSVSRKKVEGPSTASASSKGHNSTSSANNLSSTTTTAATKTYTTVAKNPALTSQFAWSLIHRFACGERSVAIATPAWGVNNNSDPVNLLHVMTPPEIARWLCRNFSALGDRRNAAIGSEVYCGVKIRIPVVVRQKDKAKDAFAMMVEHRADACAIVNMSGEFVGELWIDDILRIVRRTGEEGSLDGDEWDGVKEALAAFGGTNSRRNPGDRSPALTPVPKVNRLSATAGRMSGSVATGGRKLMNVLKFSGPMGGNPMSPSSPAPSVGGGVTNTNKKPNPEAEQQALEAAKEAEIAARIEDDNRYVRAFNEINMTVQEYMIGTAPLVRPSEAERQAQSLKEGQALLSIVDAFKSGLGNRAKVNMERERTAAAEKAAKALAMTAPTPVDGRGGRRQSKLIAGAGWGVLKSNLASAKIELEQHNAILNRISLADEKQEEKKEEITVDKSVKAVESLVPQTRPHRTVKREDSLAVVVQIMGVENKGRVFVLDNQKIPIGVVVLADICKLVIDQCELDVVRLQEKEKADNEDGASMTAEDVDGDTESSAQPPVTGTKERGGSFSVAGAAVELPGSEAGAAVETEGGEGEEGGEGTEHEHRVSMNLEDELNLLAAPAARKRADTGQLYDDIELSHSEGSRYLDNLTEGDEEEGE